MRNYVIAAILAILMLGCTYEVPPLDINPEIEVDDQNVVDQVNVDRVQIPVDGWLVVHKDSGGQPGEVIGRKYVDRGTHDNIIVNISKGGATDQLYVMLHEDKGQDRVFEFPGDDEPLTVGGDVVVVDFRDRDLSQGEVEQIAEEYIRNSPTFAYDGRDLELDEHIIRESLPQQHILTYIFESTQAGYGNRSDEIVAQVITPHIVVLEIVEGEVISALMDGEWDIVEQRMVDSNIVELKYQPIQCVDTPWEDWYEEGDVNFPAEPSDRELIIAYYASEKDVGIIDFERLEPDIAVCQACNTCPRSYYFTVEVQRGQEDNLLQEGWERIWG